MCQRRAERDCHRAALARRTQPQIDAEDITFIIDMAHQLHQAACHALGRFARFIALTPGQKGGIVKQDRIDV